MEQHFENYIKRGDLISFGTKLNKGKCSLHRKIIDYALSTKDLDIKIRGNKIHVYYKGGKILDIGANSFKVEEKYETKSKANEIKEAIANLKKATTNKEITDYFEKIKAIMNEWFRVHPKDEREHQQYISVNNKTIVSEDDDRLYVIDIEFACSFNSHYYNKKYYDKIRTERKGTTYTRYPNPRFDIIAVDNLGQIYVIELKTGNNSVGNLRKHVDDFQNFIGDDESGDNPQLSGIKRWKAFNKEMELLVKAGKHIDTIDEKIKVDTCLKPIFRFAFTEKKGAGNNQKEEFSTIVANEAPEYSKNIIFIDTQDYILRKCK